MQSNLQTGDRASEAKQVERVWRATEFIADCVCEFNMQNYTNHLVILVALN